MIPPRKHLPEENTDSWLMSYADMITLLLCFFIIFVSVSEPRRDKFSAITYGLANKFGSIDLSTPLAGLSQSLQEIVESHQLVREVAVEKTDRSVTAEIAGGTFFKANSAELDETQLQTLSEMAEALTKANMLDADLIIEGHTSNAPTTNPLYASNWELSSVRAARLARFFIEHGIEPNRLNATGLADSKPKVPHADDQGITIAENQAKNERMVIRFVRH